METIHTYYAKNGRVYVKRYGDGPDEEAATALSANGRDLERHDNALQAARRQREAMHKPSSDI